MKKVGIFQSQEEIDNYTWTNPETGEVSKIQPNAAPGDLKFLDYNNDGQISDKDRHWIGDMDPLFTVNFGNTLSYKNFSLYFNFRWMQGSDTHFLGFDPNAFGTNMASGAQLDAIEPWTVENHSDKYPRYGYNNSLNYLYWNSRDILEVERPGTLLQCGSVFPEEIGNLFSACLPFSYRPVHDHRLVWLGS